MSESLYWIVKKIQKYDNNINWSASKLNLKKCTCPFYKQNGSISHFADMSKIHIVALYTVHIGCADMDFDISAKSPLAKSPLAKSLSMGRATFEFSRMTDFDCQCKLTMNAVFPNFILFVIEHCFILYILFNIFSWFRMRHNWHVSWKCENLVNFLFLLYSVDDISLLHATGEIQNKIAF